MNDATKALSAQGGIQCENATSPIDKGTPSSIEPPCQKLPPETWEKIAVHIPRFHLQTWLFVSRLHRDIASRHIFHTLDIYFSEDEVDRFRALDIFDRAKNDPVFANRVKSLRLHAGYARDDLLRVMIYIFKLSLPAFTALRNFEWIGYPDMPREVVQVLLNSHENLSGLGLMVETFSDMGFSAYDKLHKFILTWRKSADMGGIRNLLDRNESSLKYLILGGPIIIHNPELSWDSLSWDSTFESVTINNLTQLHLVHIHISHFVLTRVLSAHKLQSLTLHRAFLDKDSASVLFASDRIVDGSHTLLPHLEAFRLLLHEGVNRALYQSVVHFLQKRDKLRSLDLGTCRWDIIRDILPDMTSLRVLGVHIDHSSQEVIESLVESIPKQMVAISIFSESSDRPLDEYAYYFSRFHTLSFLYLFMKSGRIPGGHVFRDHTDKSFCNIAATIPSLDFFVWGYVPFIVVRRTEGCVGGVQLEILPMNRDKAYGAAVDMMQHGCIRRTCRCDPE